MALRTPLRGPGDEPQGQERAPTGRRPYGVSLLRGRRRYRHLRDYLELTPTQEAPRVPHGLLHRAGKSVPSLPSQFQQPVSKDYKYAQH